MEAFPAWMCCLVGWMAGMHVVVRALAGCVLEQRCCWCWSSCASGWLSRDLGHPSLGAAVRAWPLVSVQLQPWQSAAVPASAEAPGLLRAHAHPGGCKLPKGF